MRKRRCSKMLRSVRRMLVGSVVMRFLGMSSTICRSHREVMAVRSDGDHGYRASLVRELAKARRLNLRAEALDHLHSRDAPTHGLGTFYKTRMTATIGAALRQRRGHGARDVRRG